MYTVEHNVELPPSHRHRKSKWPFHDMKVGDSFVVADIDRWKYAQACASIYGKRLGRRFTTRQMDDGLRVWRIK